MQHMKTIGVRELGQQASEHSEADVLGLVVEAPR